MTRETTAEKAASRAVVVGNRGMERDEDEMMGLKAELCGGARMRGGLDRGEPVEKCLLCY